MHMSHTCVCAQIGETPDTLNVKARVVLAGLPGM
jgi:hypothetical protein